MASDTNVFLVHNGLQGAGYTATGVKAVKFAGDSSLLLGNNATNSVLAIAVHHMEYVADPTLRPTFRLVAYNPTKHQIVATLVEFAELEHIFNLNHHLIMHAYGTGLSGVDGASLDAIIDMTYQASTNPAIPATPLRVSIKPLGTVKPAKPPGFTVPSTVDEGLVTLFTDDTNQVLEVDVTGTGAGRSSGCNVNLSATTLNFGTPIIGTITTNKLILRNNGSLPCTVSGIFLNGGSAFSVVAPPLPFSLGTNDAITLVVKYAPPTNVNNSAVLEITSTDPVAPQQYVTLTGGTSIAPSDITASPGLLNFGSVQVGTNLTLNLTIVNHGGTVGTVTALSFGAVSNSFSVAPAAPFIIPSLATQTVAVTFRPFTLSDIAGTLQISDDGPGHHTTSIGLVAAGIEPVCALQVGSTSLDFGAVTNGGTRTIPVTVANSSLAPCSINSINYTGSNNFTNFPAVTLPLVLQPGATTNLNFSFRATGGMATGTAIIAGNSSSTTISFSGLGATSSASCAVNVSQTNLVFGNVAVGSTNTLAFVVSNTSATNCTVSALTPSGSPNFITFAQTPPISLPAGSGVEIVVQYVPTGEGVDNGTLQVVSGDLLNPIVTVALSGNGVLPFAGLSTNILQFGQLPAGSTLTLTNRLSNPGGVNATIYSISLSGSLNFTLDPIVPRSRFELTNNAQVIIPVTYVAPNYPSTDVGTVIISNNAPGSPLVFSLSGVSLQSVLSLTLGNWTFGAVPIGETNSVTMTVNNTGNESGTIEDVEVAGSGRYAYTISPSAPILVGPGSSANLNIAYIPANVRTIVIFGGAVTSAGKPSKVSP